MHVFSRWAGGVLSEATTGGSDLRKIRYQSALEDQMQDDRPHRRTRVTPPPHRDHRCRECRLKEVRGGTGTTAESTLRRTEASASSVLAGQTVDCDQEQAA